MKKIPMLCLVLCASLSVFCQNLNVEWSDQLKTNFNGSVRKIVAADTSGVYILEQHVGYKLLKGEIKQEIALIKTGPDLQQVYSTDLTKEIGDKYFIQFFSIKDKLYILARGDGYYAAPVDKSTGNLSGEWKLLSTVPSFSVKLGYNADSSRLLFMSALYSENEDTVTYQVNRFDRDLLPVGDSLVMTNVSDPKTCLLQDMLLLSNGNFAFTSRILQYEDGKKHKDKFLDFSNYNTRIYDSAGRLIKEINTKVDGIQTLNTDLVQEPGKDLVLLSFYNSEKSDDEAAQLLVQRIDPATGQVIFTKKYSIDGISHSMHFRKVLYTADGGLVILAEESHIYMTSSADAGQMPKFDEINECGNIMMAKIDAKGNLSWAHILPKEQEETMISGLAMSEPPIDFSKEDNYLYNNQMTGGYSSFTMMDDSVTVYMFFNDDEKNKDVLQLGQNMKSIQNFRKNDFDCIKLNKLTGQCMRTTLFYTKDVPTPMSSSGLGYASVKDMFMLAGDFGAFLSHGTLKVVKIHLPD